MRRPGVVPDGVAWALWPRGGKAFGPPVVIENEPGARAPYRARQPCRPPRTMATPGGRSRRASSACRAPRAWRPPPVKHIHGVRHNTSCAFGVRVSAHPPFKARAQLVAWAKANTGERA